MPCPPGHTCVADTLPRCTSSSGTLHVSYLLYNPDQRKKNMPQGQQVEFNGPLFPRRIPGYRRSHQWIMGISETRWEPLYPVPATPPVATHAACSGDSEADDTSWSPRPELRGIWQNGTMARGNDATSAGVERMRPAMRQTCIAASRGLTDPAPPFSNSGVGTARTAGTRMGKPCWYRNLTSKTSQHGPASGDRNTVC